MKDYLNYINDSYPVRRSNKQKEMFRNEIIKESKELGYDAKVITLDGKHNNVVIGDVANAKVVFTAHYDTPAASAFPNIMIPRNRLLFFMYQFFGPLLLAALSIGGAYLIKRQFDLEQHYFLLAFLFIYYLLYFLLYRTFTNKHNKNDNTSGVSTILSIMERISDDNKNKVSYILFDNEEKGKLGSKAMSKAYSEWFNDKLIINFDCVGNGNNILTVGMPEALQLNDYKILQKILKDNDNYHVEHFPIKGSQSNSDYKNFNTGIGVMACKKKKGIGFYTPRIHTFADKIADSKNIEFLADSFVSYVNELSSEDINN